MSYKWPGIPNGDYSFDHGRAVWNKIINYLRRLSEKLDSDIVDATADRRGMMTAADKDKLDGVEPGAEANQNAFSNVKVGPIVVAADAKTDTLELVAGNNVTLTPDAANDKVTIAATDTTYSNFTGATAESAGAQGLVPTPPAGGHTSCLMGNGGWAIPTYINTTEATLNSARPVWFSFVGENQRACYNTGFTYNPGTGNLVVGKINGFTIEKSVPSDAKFTDTVYSHPFSSGYKHLPSGGQSGDILQWIADGNAYWTPREQRFYAAQNGSTTTNPWYKVASFSATEANYNAELVLLVNDTYYGLGAGILKINVRFGSDKHVRFQDSRFVWLSNSNFSYDDFVLVQPSSYPDTVELWTQIRSNWTYRFFTVLTQGSRVTREQLWYFHNSASQGQAAAPTSGTQLVSTAATRSYDNIRKFEDGTMMMFTTRAWTTSSTDYSVVTFTEPFIAPPAVSLTFFSTTGATNQIRVSEITATGFKWAYRNGTAYTNGASASFIAIGRWK